MSILQRVIWSTITAIFVFVALSLYCVVTDIANECIGLLFIAPFTWAPSYLLYWILPGILKSITPRYYQNKYLLFSITLVLLPAVAWLFVQFFELLNKSV